MLVDGAGVIYESAIIDEYLEEKFPEVQLMPTDLLLRAKARIWIDFMSSRIHTAASDINHERNLDKAIAKMAEHLRTIDEAIAGKKFLVGDRYSLADITFIPFYTRRERYKTAIDDNYPNLRSWAESLIARPQVAATL